MAFAAASAVGRIASGRADSQHRPEAVAQFTPRQRAATDAAAASRQQSGVDVIRESSKQFSEARIRENSKNLTEAILQKNNLEQKNKEEHSSASKLPNGFLGRVLSDPEGCEVPDSGRPSTGDGKDMQEAGHIGHAVSEPPRQTPKSPATSTQQNASASMARMLAEAQSNAQVADRLVSRKKKMFNLSSGCLVLVNVVVIALETDFNENLENRSIWLVIDAIFLLAYTIEIGIRMYWERWEWTKLISNWVDAFVAILGVIIIVVLVAMSNNSTARSLYTLRLIKLVRLVGLMKLVRAFKSLYVILVATWQAVVTMSVLFVFVFIGFLIYSIFGVTAIGRNSDLDDVVISGQYSPYECFGTIPRAMYTLFQLMILEGWENISRPLVEEEPLLIFFIFSFIGIFTFGMMNMIVAVVIEKTMVSSLMMEEQLHELKKEQMAQELEIIKGLVADAYCHEDVIKYKDFEAALRDDQVIGDFFGDMGFSIDEAKRLYEALDLDGNGDLSADELFDGISKLQFSEYSIMNILAMHTMVRQSRRRLADYMTIVLCEVEDFQIWSKAFEDRQKAQASAVQEAEECLRVISGRNTHDDVLADGRLHFEQVQTPMPSPRSSRLSLPQDEATGVRKSLMHTPTPFTSARGVEGEASLAAWKSPSRRNSATREDLASQNWTYKRKFDLAMGAIIITNVFLIALETDIDYDPERPERMARGVVWILIDTIFVLIFVTEIAVRAYYQRWAWFHIKWNWFDLLLTLMAMIDAWIISFIKDSSGALSIVPVIRILRLARLVRLLKLAKIYSELYVILMSLGQTLQSMCTLFLIMFFGIIVYSIFAVRLIGRNSALQHVRIMGTETVDDRFGSIFRSMYSLFELMTLEGWDTVFRPILEEEPWLFLLVSSFIMLFSFGLLNMIIAMVIQKTIHFREVLSENYAREERTRMLKEMLLYKPMVNKGASASSELTARNLSTSGCKTVRDLETTLTKNANLQKLFMDMGCSKHEALDFFEVFDWDGKGQNTLQSFCEGLLSLQISNSTLWHLLATQAMSRSCQRGLNRCGKCLQQAFADEEKVHAVIRSCQSAQDEALQHLGNCLDDLLQARKQ